MSKPLLLVPGHIKSRPEVKPIDHIMGVINGDKRGVNTLILKAAPGTGKSTILPVYLHNNDRTKKILVVEPKIFTVISLVNRLISQGSINENFPKFKLGQNIGYYTGQYYRIPPAGVVFMTFGSFVRVIETETDEHLRENFSAIMIDEAHDMELFSANVYKLLRDFMARNKGRADCPSLILTSATLDTKHFAQYFNNANVVEVSGHLFDVKKIYLKYDTDDYFKATAEKVLEIHTNNPADKESRDILVFFPGVREIDVFLKFFAKNYSNDPRLAKKIIMLPVYRKIINESQENIAGLNQSAEHYKVSRKVILATSIGEAGITYAGLKYVIDIGLSKSAEYLYDYNATVVYNKVINRLSQEQRMGRVGRTGDGEYHALFSEETAKQIPEIMYNLMFKVDISTSVLNLLDKYPNINLFNPDLIYNPTPHSIWRALEKLYLLGFITSNGALTPSGLVASKIKGLRVEQIKMILAAFVWKAPVVDVISIAICCNFAFEFKRKTTFAIEAECDFIPIIEALYTGELVEMLGPDFETFVELRDSIIDTLAICGLNAFENVEKSYPNTDGNYIKTLKQCIYEGLKLNSAYWDGSKYMTQSGNEIYKKFPCNINCFVFLDLFLTIKSDGIEKTPDRISIIDGFINYTPDFF